MEPIADLSATPVDGRGPRLPDTDCRGMILPLHAAGTLGCLRSHSSIQASNILRVVDYRMSIKMGQVSQLARLAAAFHVRKFRTGTFEIFSEQVKADEK